MWLVSYRPLATPHSSFCQEERRGLLCTPRSLYTLLIYCAKTAEAIRRDAAALRGRPDHCCKGKRPHSITAAAPARRRRGAAPRCSGRHTQPPKLETRNAAPNHRKENESDPTATPAPPQAAREQKRAAPLKKMSGLLPHIKTTPYDKRFPSTNQASHCWNRYNEYVTVSYTHLTLPTKA